MELVLIFILPFSIPILIQSLISFFSFKRRTTSKESQHLDLLRNKKLLSSTKKVIGGFKIATNAFLFIPTLYCIINISHGQLGYHDVLNPYILLIIPAFAVFASSMSCVSFFCNQLFSATSNAKAIFFLSLPFIPSISLGIYFVILGIAIDEGIKTFFLLIGIKLLILYAIALGIMAFILVSIRKSFTLKINQSNS